MNKHYSTIFIIFVCLLLSFLHSPLYNIFYDDKEIFRYTGWVIYKGGVPYRDFFDHKPPLIFFLNYFGILLGSWGLWLLDTGMVLFASLSFLKTCKKYTIACSWLLPLFFNLLIRNNLVSLGIGMTREYTAIFLLLFFCTLVGNSRYKYFLLGLYASLTFFMQQDQVLLLLPFFAFALMPAFALTPAFPITSEHSVPFFKRIAGIVTGVLVVVFPIFAYFILHKALHNMWEDAFLFNFFWYAEKKSLLQHFVAIKNGLDGSNYKLAFIVSLTLGLAALLLHNRKKWLVLAALLTTGLSFTSEYLSGKLSEGSVFYYYFLPLAASLPILLFTVFAFTEDSFMREKKNQLIYGAILSCSLAYTLLQYATHLPGRKDNYVEQSAGFRYLRQKQLKDGELYIFYNSSFVYAYNQFQILSPSPWIYHYFWNWYPGWDADQRILKSITGDLQQHRTTYVLDYSDSATFRNPHNYTYWKSFLLSNYQPVSLSGAVSGSEKILLWQRRPQ